MNYDLGLIEPVTIGDGSAVTRAAGVACTYYDKNGALQSVTDASLRITYDPADLSAAPYPLIEPAATNLLRNSEGAVSTLDVSGQVSNAAASITGFTNSIQFGDNSATRWAYHTFSTVPGTTYTLSVFVQMDDGRAPVFGLNSDPLADMSMVAQSDVWGAVAEVRYMGGGVYRAFFVFTANTVNENYGVAKYSAQSSRGFRVTGYQLVTGNDRSSYIKTGAAPVTRPADVIGPNFGLIYSSLTENDADDAPLYNPATTYAAGARVRRAETHRIYESTLAGNVGNTPELNATGTDAKWLDVGPTNKWAMFDGDVSTPSSAASSLTVVFRPGAFNALYGAGIDADMVQVCVQDAPGGNIVLRYTGTLEASEPADYDEYFWSRFKPQTDFLLTDVDPYHQCIVTVTLSKEAGTVKCGVLLAGDQILLGATERGVKAKPKTYSYIKTDDYGNTTIKRRRKGKDLSLSAWVSRTDANWAEGVVERLLDVPVVVVAGEVRCYGLVSGEMSWDYPQDCKLSLSVLGIINATIDTTA